MNIINFSATVVHAEKNNQEKFYMVGLADGKYDFENYIILQKAFKFDKHAIQAGMDGPYFEVNGQENSGYKYCIRSTLKKNSIDFELDTSKGVIEKVVVDISGVNVDEKFIEYLKIILGEILVIQLD